jgi:tetratricopeptide (TPR) repeat protein
MAMKNTLLVVLLLLYSPAFIYSQVKEEETVVNGVGLPENQDAENIYNQGVSFYKQKMFEDAIRSFDKAIQLKPNFDKAISKIAKSKGFYYKREYLDYLTSLCDNK